MKVPAIRYLSERERVAAQESTIRSCMRTWARELQDYLSGMCEGRADVRAAVWAREVEAQPMYIVSILSDMISCRTRTKPSVFDQNQA